MISANELRIGNLIYNGIGEPFPVNATTIGNFVIGELTLGKFKPIPLTEEWMVKFGYKKGRVSDDFYLDVDNFALVFGEDKFELMGDGGYDYTGELDLKNIVKFVHQLQNLYFALTGSELTIKQ